MKAIYPGTFDPPTLGHLDIAKRAAHIFGNLIVAVGNNPQKKSLVFEQSERVQMWKTILKDPKIEIIPFEGLLVDFAEQQNSSVIIRAIRNSHDFEQETLQGQMNRTLSGIETFYLMVDEKYRMISSTLVKEIAYYGKRLEAFVPQEIEERVFQRLNAKNGCKTRNSSIN